MIYSNSSEAVMSLPTLEYKYHVDIGNGGVWVYERACDTKEVAEL